jgi:hypothetical protein
MKRTHFSQETLWMRHSNVLFFPSRKLIARAVPQLSEMDSDPAVPLGALRL